MTKHVCAHPNCDEGARSQKQWCECELACIYTNEYSRRCARLPLYQRVEARRPGLLCATVHYRMWCASWPMVNSKIHSVLQSSFNEQVKLNSGYRRCTRPLGRWCPSSVHNARAIDETIYIHKTNVFRRFDLNSFHCC